MKHNEMGDGMEVRGGWSWVVTDKTWRLLSVMLLVVAGVESTQIIMVTQKTKRAVESPSVPVPDKHSCLCGR